MPFWLNDYKQLLIQQREVHHIGRHSVKKIPTALYAAEKILVTIIVLIVGGMVYSGCSTEPVVKDQFMSISKPDSTIQQNSNVLSPSYVFRIGDQLRISIRGYSEFDTTMFIAENGIISIRLIGDITAAGVSRAQLSEEIVKKLSVYIKSEIHPSIIVLNALVQKVAVLGAVVKQDNYTIPTDVTVLQMLAMAGGATTEADLQHIKIFRKGDTGNVEEIDFTKYISNGSIGEMPMLKPGDTLYVPREENIIRELSSFFRDAIFLFTLFTISN